MIWLWVVMGVMTAGVLVGLLYPLLSMAGGNEPQPDDMAVYRDQLDELARDQALGTLSPGERAAARLEIERRLLAASGRRQALPPVLPSRLAAGVVLVALPLAAVALYLFQGAPDQPDQPLSSRGPERLLLASDGTLDPAKAKSALEARLKQDPDSLDGWLLLARTDASLGDWAAGAAAYDRARVLSHDRPDVLEADGDLLTSAAQGIVTPEAEALFRRAADTDATRVKARYYLALAAAQRNDLAAAIAGWKALEADAPSSAPWRASVVALREAAERQLAGGATPVPTPAGPQDPAAAQIAKLPPATQMQAIRGMVDALAARLAVEPDDLAGWQRLARAYVVLGEKAKARLAYERILVLAPTDPDALWQVGLAAASDGRKDEAISIWRRLLNQLQPGSDEAIQLQQAIDRVGVAEQAQP